MTATGHIESIEHAAARSAVALYASPLDVHNGRRTIVLGVIGLALIGISGQLVRLATLQRIEPRAALAEPTTRAFLRPDIVDRNSRLLATDVSTPSLFADPTLIIDLDETVEQLGSALPGLDEADVRRTLADRSRRFVWIRRGLVPVEAQRVHDKGLPGLGFRQEPKRVYPNGSLGGHVLGSVNVDNRGQAGIERHIDESIGVEGVSGMAAARQAPVRLSLDLGVQQAVTDELAAAIERHRAKAATGLVMDALTGEIVASVSLPGVDPNRPATALEATRADRLHAGVFELGSIFKAVTIAQAIDERIVTLDSTIDVTKAIEIGRYKIRDHYPSPGPLTVRDIFLHSSNVGAGRLALSVGATRQKAFLAKLGLTEPMRTEVGLVAAPMLPKNWGEIETVTIGYGHGLALAPVQFAAAAATLINGGTRVVPTFVRLIGDPNPGERLISAEASAAQREIWRLNVAAPQGTGKRADVPGLRVGGKTGTAEIPGVGGYQAKAVIASFVAALPMEAPRWLILVSVFEPQGTPETKNAITAAHNAAPTTSRIVAHIAPILGVLPRRLEARAEAKPGTEP